MLLAIKIGNTNIAYGVFEGTSLVRSWRVQTRPSLTADEYASQLLDLFENDGELKIKISSAALVSVVPPLTPTFEDMCRHHLGCEAFVVGPGVRSGIKIHYEDPRALGADRMVVMVAARSRYGSPALVIDFGTATTFNVLDAGGNFVGGAIAPGPTLEAEALHHFTAKLPLVQVSPPPRALASNTRDSLRSGIFFGYTGLVEGLIARLRAESSPEQPVPRQMRAAEARSSAEQPIQVIATGGMSGIIAPYCPSIGIVDPHLALDGLRILYGLNHEDIS